MKNKKLTWILLPVVLGVWGMIGWKVYAAMNAEEDVMVTTDSAPSNVARSSFVPDTYQLALNYRDPFFESKPEKIYQNSSSHQQSETNVIKKTEPQSVSWPTIIYSGLVRQPQSGKTVAFLSVNGSSQFVNAGDVVNDVAITKVWSDSIEVKFGKEIRRVRK